MIWGGGNGTGTGFSPNASVFPIVIPRTLHTYFVLVAFTKDKRAEPGNLPITSALSKIGKLSIKKYFHLCFKLLVSVSVSVICKRNTHHPKTNLTLLVS